MEATIYPAIFCIAMAILKVYEFLRSKGKSALILWTGPILALCTTFINHFINYRTNIVDDGLIANASTFIFSTLLLAIAYLIPLAILILWDKNKSKATLSK